MAPEATTFTAYTCKSKGQRFEKTSYEPEPLGDHDIEIRVTHNGLCHTDIHMRDDDWNATTFPLVAGHEVVGIVEAVGSKVTSHKIGDRVAYGWLRDSCRCCRHCLKGEENICLQGYTGLILSGNRGGFQPRLRAPADFALQIPPALDSEAAAPLMCAGITVYNPLRTYVTRPGMRVGVLGIGGLGHVAIQIAKAMGCHVTVFSTSASKEAEAREFGAHEFFVYNADAAPGAGYGLPAGTEGVDLLINCSPVLPPAGDFRNMMSLLRADGTLVMTGIPPDSKGTIGLLDLIFGQKKFVGSIVGGRFQLQEMLEFCAVNGIKPKTQVMKLSQLNEAMELVLANKARYRIVLETDE